MTFTHCGMKAILIEGLSWKDTYNQQTLRLFSHISDHFDNLNK